MERVLSNKEALINEITRMEVVMYRKRGLAHIGKHTIEPPGFRVELYDIYNKLSMEDLQVMYDMKRERYEIK
jgi:hypothetical protein